MFRKATAFVAAVLAMGAVVAPAHAQSDVSSELAKMRAEIAELRAETGKTYVEGRRADEVKAMIGDVLEDSESRNALADGSSTAGYKKGFFLASADGNFKMEIGILVRVRWYANFRDWDDYYDAGNDAEDNEISTGFTVYEAEIGFEGHVFDPNILYSVVIEVDEVGNVVVDTAAIGYAGFFDGLEVWAGTGIGVSSTLDQDKSSKRQQAVERSYTTRRLDFSGGSAVGIAASWSNNFISVAASFTNSGSPEWHSGNNDHNNNNGGYTLGTRVAIKLLGDWKQYKDFASWSGQDVMLVIGGGFAVAYGTNDNGAVPPINEEQDDWHAILWTVDASFEWNGVSIWISGLGVHGVSGDSDNDTAGYLELYGIVGTVAYNIMDTVELFVRGEGVIIADDNGGDSSDFNNQGLVIITVGGTWFLYKHNLKLTADVGFIIGEVNVDDEKAGVLDTLPTAGNDNDTELQVVARVQVLLYF